MSQNYVVQFVIEHGSPTDKALVLNQMRGQILALARHKFASNVCEKALVFADSETRAHLIDEIMMPTADGVSPLVIMMKDQFASTCFANHFPRQWSNQLPQTMSSSVPSRPRRVSRRRCSSRR